MSDIPCQEPRTLNNSFKESTATTRAATTMLSATSEDAARPKRLSNYSSTGPLLASPPKKSAKTLVITHRDQLEVFNLLDHPVWVFDIVNKAMWWANQSALDTIWNANSLQELLDRDFATDMSQATERRLAEYMQQRFSKNERVKDSWTYYPKGDGPVTVYNTMSGIWVKDDDGDDNSSGTQQPRMLMLNEAEMTRTSDTIDQSALRAMELLRHLPVTVGQFDAQGQVMEQNPAGLDVFGGARCCDRSCKNSNENKQNDNYACNLISRFISPDEGTKAWNQVYLNDVDYVNEIQQRTRQGIRWFAVQMRRSKDPVTGEVIVLYSARDISAQVEAKQSMEEFAYAKEQADEANMAKSEFVAVMGHEMRTPLHQVLGFLELMRATTGLDEKQREYLDLVETSASALMAVVNDLLDFTKLEAGKMVMERIQMNPCKVAREAVKVLEPNATKKGLRIFTNIHISNEEDIPAVMGDPSRLRQVLLNYLGNAVRFTHEGEVSLHVRRLPAPKNGSEDSSKDCNREEEDMKPKLWLEFTVEDTGIGIDAEQTQHIFNKYQQANSAITRKYGGTGLGLAICKIIAETLGGSIGVHSVLGKGSKFWFRVPYSLASPASALPQLTLAVNTGARIQPKPATVGIGDKASSGRALHVLVAEDNKVNQKLAASFLRRLGHQSTIVDNGQLAVEAVEQGDFDVVLMDISMPVMDGIEATKQIRKLKSSDVLPILGLTAHFNYESLDKFKGIGMNDCMGKPIRMIELKRYLLEATATRE